jgi:hypothetical protein
MRRVGRAVLLLVAIVVVSMPVTFVVTILLMPLWSAIERHWGIESVGHSGPADWCFWLVFATSIMMFTLVARRLRRTRRGVSTTVGDSPP